MLNVPADLVAQEFKMRYIPKTLTSILNELAKRGYPEVEDLTLSDIKELYKHEFKQDFPDVLDIPDNFKCKLTEEDIKLLKLKGAAPVTRRFLTEPKEVDSASIYSQYNQTED